MASRGVRQASGGVRQASFEKSASQVQSFLRACGRTYTLFEYPLGKLLEAKLLKQLLYSRTGGPAVKRYIITTAAAVRIESAHIKSHNPPNHRNEKKNRAGFSI